MVTIKEVAKKAGVSPSTVSRVMNNRDIVDLRTIEKVEHAIKELNYIPNTHARILAGNKNFLLGVILPDIINPYFSQLLEKIEETAYRYGYNIIFMNSHNDILKEKRCIESLKRRNLDGIIITPISDDKKIFNQLEKLKIPILTLTKIFPDINGVAIDHKIGGELVAKHFSDLGHKNVSVISDTGGKKIGFMDGVEKYNLNLIDFYKLEVYQFERVKSGVSEYSSKIISDIKNRGLSAVFCGNDLIALELISSLEKEGIKVPEDVAVAGFDNTIFSIYSGITSVSQPVEEIVHMGFEILLEDKGNNEEKKIENIILKPRLIPRRTTINLVNK